MNIERTTSSVNKELGYIYLIVVIELVSKHKSLNPSGGANYWGRRRTTQSQHMHLYVTESGMLIHGNIVTLQISGVWAHKYYYCTLCKKNSLLKHWADRNFIQKWTIYGQLHYGKADGSKCFCLILKCWELPDPNTSDMVGWIVSY